MRFVIALATLLSTPAQAAPAAPCLPMASFWSPALFARYPAPRSKGPWRVPDTRRGEAHMYRTSIRDFGQGDPNFAGHLKVVENGCGAGAICPIFVDRITGRALFRPEMRVVTWMSGDMGTDHERLIFRRDSRLLVLIGARNEDEATAGITLYDWRTSGPRLVRFVPQAKLCEEGQRP